ncbi:MAG: hypothetical protein K1X53_08145 [Candidatus Sumerlaeaceae bacterium]|nr:hypothetical protein [Candidatus Sumerlaeaceae bacterium]
MSVTGVVIFAVVFFLLSLSLLTRHRSPVIGVLTALFGLIALGGAWYAWMETKSGPWTLGYAAVAAVALASALRQFMDGRDSKPQP